MCGIVGMASFARPVSDRQVRRMAASLVHRGPDEDGFYATERVALGVRRLRIIDLEGSRQPVHNEDKTVWAVFNGENYNFKRLRKELAGRGHRFYTQGDSEVIVHAYEEWGERCVDHLMGMFAIALWDERRQRLLLFRDRVGIKPLYWAMVDDTLLFGSEMKALLNVRSAYPLGDLSPRALLAFLSFGYVPAPLTMFERAHCLPPGHQLRFQAGMPPTVEAYWDVPWRPRQGTIDDEERATEEFRVLLREAVTDQIVSDVPVGAFVSGGLDSTAVVSTMAELSAEPVRTFSVGFAEATYDETPWARKVAASMGALHFEELISPRQVAGELSTIVGFFDEPFADSSAVPLHFLARMARANGVTVILTGDGGDELFGGYETYLADRLLMSFQRLPSPVRALARRAGVLVPVSHRKVSLEQKLKRFIAFSESRPLVAHALWRSIFFVGELRDVLVDGLGEGLTDRRVADLLVGDIDRLPAGEEGINSFCYLDTKFYLPADMLVKVDRVTMAHSLEARVPLLDERLVDLAFRLAPSLKWRGLTNKVLLRRALRGRVDNAIINRPKAGFNVPIPTWIIGPLRDLFRDVLAPSVTSSVGVFRPEYVGRLLDEHERRRADHSYRLYALLAFHLWFWQHGRAGTE